jgi:hypothetical protein
MERSAARAALSALALFLAAACAGPGGAKPPAAAGGDLEVTSDIETVTTRPREGDLATVSFRIRNGRKNVVVLRDLTYLADPKVNEMASAAASWQFSQPGRLEYRADSDEWIYDRARPAKDGPRAAVFNSGLLAPGEVITVRTRIRLLRFPKLFHIVYFELLPEELWRKVYWEVRRDRDVRYRPALGRELESRLIPGTDPAKGGHRVVIFPHAEASVIPSASLKLVRVEATLDPRPFGLDQAVRRSGGAAPDQFTYSTALDGWILRRGEEFVLVTPSGPVPLPRIRQMERFFYHVDDVGVGKLQIHLKGRAIAQALQERGYALVAQVREVAISSTVKEKITDYFVFFLPIDLPRLLADVRALKLVMDVDLTADGGRLQVTD